jgi:membrane-bound lytic murein transglycosylase D
MNYAAEHNIYPAMPRKTYFEVDTVVVKDCISFSQLGQFLSVTEEELLYFNPQYRKNIIPAGGNMLCLPKSKIAYFLNNEPAFYASLEAQKQQQVENPFAEVRKFHTVRGGERLSTIARKYGVSVSDLQTWNYIGRKGVRPGKKLVVYVKVPQPVTRRPEAIESPATAPEPEKQLAAKPEYIQHVVKSGESLFSIAKRYNRQVSEIVELNSLTSDIVHKGQVLKIRAVE